MNNTVSNHVVPGERLPTDDIVMATLEQFDPEPGPPAPPLANFRRGVVNASLATLAVGLVAAVLWTAWIGVRWLDAVTAP